MLRIIIQNKLMILVFKNPHGKHTPTNQRNNEIYNGWLDGKTPNQLAIIHNLSPPRIRKIIYRATKILKTKIA
mgnify:CR=1 FL=1